MRAQLVALATNFSMENPWSLKGLPWGPPGPQAETEVRLTHHQVPSHRRKLSRNEPQSGRMPTLDPSSRVGANQWANWLFKPQNLVLE